MTSDCNMSNNLPKPHDKRHQTEKKKVERFGRPPSIHKKQGE